MLFYDSNNNKNHDISHGIAFQIEAIDQFYVKKSMVRFSFMNSIFAIYKIA